MQIHQIQTIFKSVAVAKLRYASPAWYGFSNARDHSRIDSFLRRAAKFGFIAQSGVKFDDMCDESDDKLFRDVMSNSNHVLHPILPVKVVRSHNLMTLYYPVDRLIWVTVTI